MTVSEEFFTNTIKEMQTWSNSLIILESAADSLLLRIHGQPAISMPPEKPEAAGLEGFGSIFVLKEKGSAGQAFVDRIARHLQKIKWNGETFVADILSYYDDLADMFLENPAIFRKRIKGIIGHVEPLVFTYDNMPRQSSLVGRNGQ